MSRPPRTLWIPAFAIVVLCLGSAGASMAAGPLAEVTIGPDTVTWQPQSGLSYHQLVLKVGMPDGQLVTSTFAAGEAPSFSVFDESGELRAAGTYTYELKVVPAAVPRKGERRGLEPSSDGAVQSGAFTIADGAFVNPNLQEAALDKALPIPTKDIIHADDVIAQFSLCVGTDCVNGENFGFDTIRLKENNLRIKFQDTSNSGSFPSNDWQITANDSTNGGLNKFSIDDIDGGKTPFTIEAGARTNALYVEADGDVGIGTKDPVLELHIVRGDSPGVRLEQDGSSGFTAQTWDMVGNETNFFIRDVTNGSKLPLRIRPNAPTSSIDIASSGKVGIGTQSPSARLHVLDTSDAATGDVHLLVENTNATTLARTMMKLSNNGNTFFDMENRNAHNWRINSNNQQYLVLDDQNDAGTEFELRPNGELRLEGALVTTSTRDAKQDIVPVDTQAIFARLKGLPIATWSYKQDPSSKHLGPMAEDFYDAFGLGSTNKGISVLDASTVALAAIQGLDQSVTSEVEALRRENADLRQRLEALEARLGETP